MMQAANLGDSDDVHKEKGFFGGLVKFMTEAPVVVMVLEAPAAIRKMARPDGSQEFFSTAIVVENIPLLPRDRASEPRP